MDLRVQVTDLVRVLNPNSHPDTVKQDSVVACAEFLGDKVDRCIVAEIPCPAEFLQEIEHWELCAPGTGRMAECHRIEVLHPLTSGSTATGRECISKGGTGMIHLGQPVEGLSGQSKERLSSCQGHENPRLGDAGDGNPDSNPDLPEYLTSLTLQATEQKCLSQKREIIELLNKHQ